MVVLQDPDILHLAFVMAEKNNFLFTIIHSISAWSCTLLLHIIDLYRGIQS